MKPLSIRTKVALFSAGLTAVALVVFATGTLANVYAEQIEAVDLELQAVVERVREIHLSAGSLTEQAIEQEAGFEPWISTAVFDERGGLHLLDGGMPEVVARAAVADGVPRTVADGPGAHRVTTAAVGAESLVVAYDLEEVHGIMVDLLSAYALSLPVVAGIVGLGAWWLAGRALRPLRSLTMAAETITSERLDSRVPVPASRDEVGQLAIVLNTMLARLETSFRQAGRFAADASHELRTPLTIMRGEIDRTLHTPGLPALVEDRMVSLQQEVARLERICDSLLLLAKFDAGRVPIGREPVDLSRLVREACEDAEMLGTPGRVRIEANVADHVCVPGDADLLRRVLLNLVDNAVKFNVRDGVVRCSLRTDNGLAVCVIANTGAGIPEEYRERVFERFFCADVARASGSGQGLGLSLACEIAGAHEGNLELAEASAPGWTEFVITLPLVR